MPGVVNIVRIDHSLQVAAFLSKAQPYPLMNDNIVKDEVEDAITKDPNGHADEVWIEIYERSIVKKRHARNAEYQCKKIIALRLVMVNGMMRAVPAP